MLQLFRRCHSPFFERIFSFLFLFFFFFPFYLVERDWKLKRPPNGETGLWKISLSRENDERKHRHHAATIFVYRNNREGRFINFPVSISCRPVPLRRSTRPLLQILSQRGESAVSSCRYFVYVKSTFKCKLCKIDGGRGAGKSPRGRRGAGPAERKGKTRYKTLRVVIKREGWKEWEREREREREEGRQQRKSKNRFPDFNSSQLR